MNEDLSVLTMDVVKEYNRILNGTLNAKSSTAYRVLESSPVPYDILPKQFSNFFLKNHKTSGDLSICDKLPLDALRFALKEALEYLVGKAIPRKTWNGRNHALLMTHDVETLEGLQRACYLKKLEEKYDIPSAWYIPSKRYKLDHETVRKLANFGEVGAHDTTHDGKLGQLPERKLVERLLEAKRGIEAAVEQTVQGFRAPLLQHSTKITCALEKAGYSYDTSIPTWEPMHPRTMKPHGIGTIYPLRFNGLTEIPVTLPQDHQLLQVLDLAPDELVGKWLEMASVIKELGGVCMLLVHPDYKLGDLNSKVYEELLNTVASDNEAWVTVPSRMIHS
jgi:peptidoglycan/xylan/chitin deacetylase (PgdA/CDA1 family)